MNQPEINPLNQPASPDPKLAVRLLGGASIEQAGQPLAQRAAHRHGLALLALLATARGRLLNRDRIIGLLWPDGDTETLRHRLNVLLYDLRRILGRDAILSVNDDIRLDPDRVWVDACCFLDALGRGEYAEADALYRGPFLDGFYLPDALEFDQWAAIERERFSKELGGALQKHALEAERAGNLREAASRWRRLIELDPLESGPVLGLMRVLMAAAEPAEAVRAGGLYEARWSVRFGTPADPGVRELSERLRSSAPPPLAPSTASPPRPSMPAPTVPEARASPRRPARRTLTLLAVPLILALALILPRLRSTPSAAATGAGTGLVILPFVVRGDDRLDYLADGMVELLAITLDGAGAIRTGDPHAVLSFLRRHPADPSDPEAGRQVASRFGAKHFVLGAVVESGRRLEVQATLYQVGGRRLVRATGTVEADGDIMPVVDALTRQLISALYPSGADRLARLAATTTVSLPGLKAYLEGEALLRDGAHKAAADAFRRATNLDSTFALAWYRLAVAAEWALQPREALAAVESAVRHAGRLPQRDSLLLFGWRAYMRGDADPAEAVYRRVLDLYPSEIEAWLQLGEIGFHYGPSRGAGIDTARAAFEAVLGLDPDHEGALVHLARIAAYAGDTPALTRHVDHLVSRGPARGVALEMQALRAFATRDRDAAARLRAEFRTEDSYIVLSALLSLFYVGNLDGVQWCADLMREPGRPPEVRTAGHLLTALIEMARGRRTPALAAAARAESLDPARGLEVRALIATAPFLPVDSAESRRVRTALEAELARQTKNPFPESFFLPDPDRARPLMQRYLLGLLSAGLGEPADAMRWAAELDRAPSPAGDPSLPKDLA
ncbi:MAG TPA: BTAD domain-containing putative transcriptional regulator, partial [Thermoanaerobaculia bacterium]|nr:BTAD domain-containing putative transcriptional regulator [Thermoanaerobaculia bacterium]